QPAARSPALPPRGRRRVDRRTPRALSGDARWVAAAGRPRRPDIIPRPTLDRHGAAPAASRLDQILLHAEIFDDEALAVRGVLAHVEGEQVVAAVEVLQADRLQADVVADEVFEFAGTDFAEALEAGDLGVLAELVQGGLFLGLAVAVEGLLLGAHAEERRLQNVDMAVGYELGEKLQEEGEQQQADVHAV